MRKIRVIIFGSQGMLGSELVKVFSEERHDAYELITPSVREADITNYSAVHSAIESASPAFIINAAAYTDVDGAEAERDLAFKVNFEGVQNLANVAVSETIPLIHYSTDYVFDGANKAGYDESAIAGPALSAYGESKLAGEESLRKINPQYYLLRTAWLYGTQGQNFVETMLQLSQERDELSVVNDQFGNPTSAYDVAQATRTLLDREKSYEPGVYHLVNQGTTSWYEFAREIFKRARVKVNLQPISSADFPTPAQRPQYSVLRNTKGPELQPWQEALSDYLKARKITSL